MVELSVARAAVAAIDAGDLDALERELAEHPELLRERIEHGEGYFRHPYLLWFVAGNPVRGERLPANVVDAARAIIAAARRAGVESLPDQIDYTLSLVCSGRVARESKVQLPLIDALCSEGAHPDGAMLPALAHREVDAARQLLERGAQRTLAAMIGLGPEDDLEPMIRAADHAERKLALAVAAFYGNTEALVLLCRLGVELNDYSPEAFHPHATTLHHAVDSRCLEAVRLLVDAGADLTIRDRVYQGTPLDWATYLKHDEIVACLRDAARVQR